MKYTIAAFALLTALLAWAPAMAHIQLLQPAQRISAQKTGPCGSGDSERGQPTTFQAGETITVVWEETIDHPSHYRISFDPDGHDAFEDPPTMMDFYSNDAVLLDEIEDEENAVQEVEITLPDITCDTCTLQLVQVMYDKPPYEPGTNDLYYQCADLVLVRGDTNNSNPDGGEEVEDMGPGNEEPDMGMAPIPGPGPGEEPDTGQQHDASTDGPQDDVEGSPLNDDDSTCSTVATSPAAALVLIFFALTQVWRRRVHRTC